MRRLVSLLLRVPAFLVECLLRFYQVALSPLLIGNCKFIPSCSEYMAQAVREWGVVRGVWLGLKRLARCRPGGIGGIDPVPRRGSPPRHGDREGQR